MQNHCLFNSIFTIELIFAKNIFGFKDFNISLLFGLNGLKMKPKMKFVKS